MGFRKLSAPGGPAREGHQQDFAGIGAIDDQVGHPVRQGVGLAGPRPGNDEEWRARRRIVLPHAMLDSPPLFRIEFFEIGDGHWLRIRMEASDTWNHLSRLVRNSPAVAVGLELLAASRDLSLADNSFEVRNSTSVAASTAFTGEGAKKLRG
jgi:hypothetical protein